MDYFGCDLHLKTPISLSSRYSVHGFKLLNLHLSIKIRASFQWLQPSFISPKFSFFVLMWQYTLVISYYYIRDCFFEMQGAATRSQLQPTSTMSTAKRPAPRTPERRPTKRRATSSPEEGELDDANGISNGQAGSSAAEMGSSGPKFKIPFPFKNKNTLLSRIDPVKTTGDRHDHDRERSRGRERDERERSNQRPHAVYGRSEEYDRRFRHDAEGDYNSRGSGSGSRW